MLIFDKYERLSNITAWLPPSDGTTKILVKKSHLIASTLIMSGVAGYLFSKNTIRTALIFPFVFGFIYLMIDFFGCYSIPMIVLVLLWGIITTIGLNFSQLWITSIATDAPQFSNGLFVSFSNLGITLGTFIGGLFITDLGLKQIAWSGIMLLGIGVIMIVWRVRCYDLKKSLIN
ncbi:MFS transporter [Paenibacillus aestuarii]|uniref:MFS transporter n=1 Tax=Paenibacillus aestuarii TaxID=516965 RepID=A0ABW0KII3_9BACL|nr:hypothetical protein [Paenibacillus aestuarii]